MKNPKIRTYEKNKGVRQMLTTMANSPDVVANYNRRLQIEDYIDWLEREVDHRGGVISAYAKEKKMRLAIRKQKSDE